MYNNKAHDDYVRPRAEVVAALLKHGADARATMPAGRS